MKSTPKAKKQNKRYRTIAQNRETLAFYENIVYKPPCLKNALYQIELLVSTARK